MNILTYRATEPSLPVRYLLVAMLCASAVPLLAMTDLKWFGWLLLGLTSLPLAWQHRSRFGRHMLVLAGSLALLGVVPISTDISYNHMAIMGSILVGTIALPYLITRYGLKDRVIAFPFHAGRSWYKREIAYIVFAGAVSYLIMPFYLANTNSYLNWEAVLEPSYIVRLFLGTNALGIWDELFFVGVCLALLREHLPFPAANLAQAALWTTFLYELGFRGWGPPLIFFFAITQGYIFRRSKSLLYIITVHLTIDFILFLTLIHLHNPEHLRIFITSPF